MNKTSGISLAAALTVGACLSTHQPKEASLARLSEQTRTELTVPIANAKNRCVQIVEHTPYHKAAIGLGAVVSPDGLILLPAHLLKDAANLSASWQDGRVLPAHLVARNAKNDIALLKVESDETLSYFSRARQHPHRTRVVAIGAPIGTQARSVSAGTIVVPDARMPGPEGIYYHDAYFHSAPTSDFDSGACLIDRHGDLVGVHAARVEKRMLGLAIGVPELPTAVAGASAPIELAVTTPRSLGESARWTLEAFRYPLRTTFEGDVDTDPILDRIGAVYAEMNEMSEARHAQLIHTMLSTIGRVIQSQMGIHEASRGIDLRLAHTGADREPTAAAVDLDFRLQLAGR